jgi:hypothetical protein
VIRKYLPMKDYYRDCVRPLLGLQRSQWPRCCGGGCEPCAETLIAVAERVLDLIGASAENPRLGK